MKISSRQIIYGVLFGFIIAGLAWKFYHGIGTPEPAGPSTISGIVIDETGNKLTGAVGTVSLISANGAVGATGAISGGGYAIVVPQGLALPATIKCVATTPAGTSAYSGIVAIDPTASMEYLTLDVTNKTPELEVIFLAHSGAPVSPSVTIINTTQGGSAPAEVAKSNANAAIGWVRYAPLVAGNTYKFNFTPAGGQQVIKQFTVPSDISTNSSVSYTFFLN